MKELKKIAIRGPKGPKGVMGPSGAGIKIYFHKFILYLLIRFYPKLFYRYFDEYLEMNLRYGRRK